VLAARMAEGTLRIAVEKTSPLEEIKQAVARLSARRQGAGDAERARAEGISAPDRNLTQLGLGRLTISTRIADDCDLKS
jgi:hypothetical protein